MSLDDQIKAERVRRFNEALERYREHTGETAEQVAARIPGVKYENFRTWRRRPVPDIHRKAVAEALEAVPGVTADWLAARDYVANGRDEPLAPAAAVAMREALESRLAGLEAIVLKIATDEPLLPSELAALRTRLRTPETPGAGSRPGVAA